MTQIGEAPPTQFLCELSSFGFKYGMPVANWVVDVRFLPNPFWVPELRKLTGLDHPARDYVLDAAETQEFLARMSDFFAWTMRQCIEKEHTSLQIAVGCTGGRHRSVAVATALGERLVQAGFDVEVHHRDVERSDPR